MASDNSDPWDDFGRDRVYHDPRWRLTVTPLYRHQLAFLRKETDQFEPWLNDINQVEAVSKREHSFALTQSGEILAAGGVQPYWQGYGLAWAVLRKGLKSEMLGIARLTRRWLDTAPYHRIEAAVRKSYAPGHRFMNVLGFQTEGTMRRYTADQEDALLYARIRDI